MLKKDVGICISTVNYSDSSQIITLLCKETGKISAIAKGSKRTKSSVGGHIEMLSCGNLIFTESLSSQLATLREFDPKPVFLALRKNLLTVNCAMFAAEMTNLFLQPAEPDQQLFEAFYNFLDDIQSAQTDSDRLSFLIVFQLYVMQKIGSAPTLSRCINCKMEKIIQGSFSLKFAGLVCKDCQSSFPDRQDLSASALNCLTNLARLNTAQEAVLREIEKIIVKYITYILNKPPKMAKYFG